MSKVYVIRFKCDEANNHTCSADNANFISQKYFEDERDALHFMSECTVTIKNIFVVSSNSVSEDITIEQLVQAQQEHDYISGL